MIWNSLTAEYAKQSLSLYWRHFLRHLLSITALHPSSWTFCLDFILFMTTGGGGFPPPAHRFFFTVFKLSFYFANKLTKNYIYIIKCYFRETEIHFLVGLKLYYYGSEMRLLWTEMAVMLWRLFDVDLFIHCFVWTTKLHHNYYNITQGYYSHQMLRCIHRKTFRNHTHTHIHTSRGQLFLVLCALWIQTGRCSMLWKRVSFVGFTFLETSQNANQGNAIYLASKWPVTFIAHILHD